MEKDINKVIIIIGSISLGFFVLFVLLFSAIFSVNLADDISPNSLVTTTNNGETSYFGAFGGIANLNFEPQTFTPTALNRTWIFLNGSTDYINITDETLLEGFSEVTICFEANLTGTTGNQGIVGDRYQTPDTNWIQTLYSSGNYLIAFKNATAEYSTSGTSNIASPNTLGQQWRHFCGTINVTGRYTYFGGFLDNRNLTHGFTDHGGNNLSVRLGTYFDNSLVRKFNGTLDNIYIYNATLTPQEILQLSRGYGYINSRSNSTVSNFSSLNLTTVMFRNGTSGNDLYMREIGNMVYHASTGQRIIFYSGHTQTDQSDVKVYWANSSNGVTWNKQGLLSNNSITRLQEDPYMIYNGSNYFLFAEDKTGNPFRNISMYVSDTSNINGTYTLKYTIDNGTAGNQWDSQDVSSPVVYLDNGVFYMFYEGRNSTNRGEIGLAWSTDWGNTWTKYANNPVVRGTPLAWDSTGIVPDDIILDNGTYFLTYHGERYYNFNIYQDNSGFYKKGMVLMTNLTNPSTYTKSAYNPIFVGGANTFNNFTDADIMFFKDGQRKFYTINQSAESAIAYYGKIIMSGDLIQNEFDYGYIPQSTKVKAVYRFGNQRGTTLNDVSDSYTGTLIGGQWLNDSREFTLRNNTDYSISNDPELGWIFTLNTNGFAWSNISLDYLLITTNGSANTDFTSIKDDTIQGTQDLFSKGILIFIILGAVLIVVGVIYLLGKINDLRGL